MLVTLESEDGSQALKVSKATLCSISDYFSNALDGGFIEGTQRRIKLPGTQQDTVKLFAFWVSRRSLPDFVFKLEKVLDAAPTRTRDLSTPYLMPLVRLWILADMLLVPKLQNEAMTQIFTIICMARVSHDVLLEGFCHAARGSALSRLLMKEARAECFPRSVHCLEFTSEQLEELAQIPGFTTDLVSTVGNPQESFMGAIDDKEDEYMVDEE